MIQKPMMQFAIHGAGHFCHRLVEGDQANLKQALKEDKLSPIRRANRFTHLAVIGAHRCWQQSGMELPVETASFLATAHGSFTDTVRLLEDQLHHDLPITPFRFVNVLSNIAGFHVASHLGLNGENMAISREWGAFDAALEAAHLGLITGDSPMAIVGGVDEADASLNLHQHRTGTPKGQTPAEGSGWLLLSTSDDSHLPRLWHGGDFADEATLSRAVVKSEANIVAVGPHAVSQEQNLAGAADATAPYSELWDYHAEMGFIWSNPAMAFAHHVESGQGRLAHVDQTGREGTWRLWLLDTQ